MPPHGHLAASHSPRTPPGRGNPPPCARRWAATRSTGVGRVRRGIVCAGWRETRCGLANRFVGISKANFGRTWPRRHLPALHGSWYVSSCCSAPSSPPHAESSAAAKSERAPRPPACWGSSSGSSSSPGTRAPSAAAVGMVQRGRRRARDLGGPESSARGRRGGGHQVGSAGRRLRAAAGHPRAGSEQRAALPRASGRPESRRSDPSYLSGGRGDCGGDWRGGRSAPLRPGWTTRPSPWAPDSQSLGCPRPGPSSSRHLRNFGAWGARCGRGSRSPRVPCARRPRLGHPFGAPPRPRDLRNAAPGEAQGNFSPAFCLRTHFSIPRGTGGRRRGAASRDGSQGQTPRVLSALLNAF